jgi:hypothetical protein
MAKFGQTLSLLAHLLSPPEEHACLLDSLKLGALRMGATQQPFPIHKPYLSKQMNCFE